MIHNSKLLAVIGPTSSGKSELAVKLAKHFNGEIISCDSRQVYKGMNIGTGKVEGRWTTKKLGEKAVKLYVYKNIVHHLIDFQNPSRQYSAARFQKEAKKIIANILKRGHLPILCGGTMHWVDAVVYDQKIPEVKPNLALRARLEKQSADVLFNRLKNLDPARASTIDKFNRRRLIRALEIVISTGKPVPTLHAKPSPLQATLLLGTNLPQDELYKKIDTRLKQRLEHGMIKEITNLHLAGLSWKKLISFGLEYKFVSLFLQKKISEDELFTQLSFAIKHYSKRQITWWKRNKDIIWIKPDIKKAEKLTKKFLKS